MSEEHDGLLGRFAEEEPGNQMSRIVAGKDAEITRLSAELKAAKQGVIDNGEPCYAHTKCDRAEAAERRCAEMERAVEVARDDAEAVLEYIADGHEASARAQIKRSVERLNAALAYTTQIAGPTVADVVGVYGVAAPQIAGEAKTGRAMMVCSTLGGCEKVTLPAAAHSAAEWKPECWECNDTGVRRIVGGTCPSCKPAASGEVS